MTSCISRVRYALRMRLASLRTILTPLAAVAVLAPASFAQDRQPTTAQAGEMDGYLGVQQAGGAGPDAR
jgi:hypothetical protein